MRGRRSVVSAGFALIVMLLLMSTAIAGSRSSHAHLTGDEEVPPRDTNATGQTVLKLSKEGSELSYKLIVANIENVLMAHIHCAPAGSNGGIVVWLYPDAPPAADPTSPDGVLAVGTITDDNIVANAPCGIVTLADLLEQVALGNAYVNVHTTQFPTGEIRGQVQ